MNYEDFLPYYPDTESSNLQQKILNKKEFSELALTTELERVSKGEFMNHQKIIQRFMNSNTLYDELLVYHETGTGKTGVAFGVTENLFESESFSKVFVFARGPDHLVSLLKQLVYVFSNRYIIPENIDEDKKVFYMRKKVSDFYRFHTFGRFASRLANMSDTKIQKDYSNKIFIVDEVHHFKSDEDANIYKQFHRLFHLTTNRKILLLSATPMRDNPNELAYIMNLILPLDQQIPTDKAFDDRFIQGNEIVNTNDLRRFLRGRITYLSNSSTDTRARFIGRYITPIQVDQFKAFITKMHPIQQDGYIDAYTKDMSKEGSIYSRSRQASLFVFPDGGYGKNSLAKYTTPSGDFLPELAQDLRTIEGLEKYSSKYAFIVDHILNNPKKLVYVYCSAVSGSGIETLSRVLELYGFQPSRMNNRPGRYYIALSSKSDDIDAPLTYFNRRENRYGELCQVIICSRKMSESFTFKNIQIIHITTMHWNYTEIQQAVARGIRFGSHRDLIKDGVRPQVEIYQHASVLSQERSNIKSLDVLMIEISQEKDMRIRRMERVIKEISIDCPLNYERNIRRSADGSRECDYQECEYECAQSSREQTEEDLSTYRLYYQKSDQVFEGLRMIFSKHFNLQFETIQDLLQVDRFILLKVLSDCIRFNLLLVNAYGIECYLRESDNRYYLVDNIALPNKQQEMGFYAQHPITSQRSSLQQIIRNHMFVHATNQIEAFGQSTTIEEAKARLENLPVKIQENIIEEAIAKKVVDRSQLPLIEWIEQIYDKQLTKQDGKYYSSLLQPRIRCLEPEEKEWKDCPPPVEEQKEFEVKIDIENNPYGYYGIIEGDRFCIRDIRNAIDPTRGKIDKRKIKTGSVCLEVGFNKPKLAEICIHLGIEVPKNELNPDPRTEFNKTKAGKKLLENWKEWTDEQLSVGLYWYEKTKKETCGVLQEWFAANGLLVQDKCGTAGKIKDSLRTISSDE